MELGLLIFRLFLAGIFGLAGFAKLADLAGSQKAVGDFGVPSSLTGIVSVVLPIIEITIAVVLLFPEISWFGAVGSAMLLTLFVAGMAYQIAKGNAPDCHCFGQIYSEPVGKASLIRNLIFLIPAIALIYKGRLDQGPALTNIGRDSVQLLLVLVAVLLLGVAIDFLRRILSKQDEVIRRVDLLELISKDGTAVERSEAGSPHDGFPIGGMLPDFALIDIGGASVSTADLSKSGTPNLFFFVSPTCNPCKAMVPQFKSWRDELAGKANIVLVSSGSASENIEKFGSDNKILLQTEREFADSVNAKWTPSVIFVDSKGRVASQVAAGDRAIIELIEKIEASDFAGEFTHFTLGESESLHNHLAIGENVPEFSVETLDGQTLKSSDLTGKKTLLAFWGATCPHCVRMADDLKNWDKIKGADEPNLVFFTDGDEETTREFGLKSPVIVDDEYNIASKLGMRGTPSAILIDEDGRFASELAMGADHFWALVGRKN